MAPPIYFFPRLPHDELVINDRLRSETLERYRLDGSLDGIESVRNQTSAFFITQGGPPKSASGMVLTMLPKGEPPARLGMHRKHQDWKQISADPELWIATDNEYPPGPADLVRDRPVQGHWVRLGDGHDWQVPIIRSLDPRAPTRLPQQIGLDQQGEIVVRIKPCHEELWKRVETVWELVYRGGEASIADLLPHCMAFLGVNYRLGPWEIERLALLDTENYIDVLKAAVDVPFIEEHAEPQKKSGPRPPDSSSTEPGSEVTTPDSDQA